MSRLESAQEEMKLLRHQSEDTELAKKQIRVCLCGGVCVRGCLYMYIRTYVASPLTVHPTCPAHPKQELKQQINLILESKAMLEDERNDLLSKLQHVSSWEEERASLRGKIEALEVEQEDSYRRVQELLEGNTQLEIERDRK